MNTNEEIKWYKEYRNKVLGHDSDYRLSEQEIKRIQMSSTHHLTHKNKQHNMSSNQTHKYCRSILLPFLIITILTSCAYYEPGSQNNSVSTYVQPQYGYGGYGGYYPYGGYGGYYPYGGYGWGGYCGWGRGWGW